MTDSKKENSISLKELVILLSGWKNFLLSKWKTIVLFGILGALIGLTYALLAKKTYIAEITFSLDDKGGNMSAYAGIASQFGIDLGKGEQGVFNTSDNIVEIFKSRIITENTLLTPVTINGKKDLLINRYIQFNKLEEDWEKEDAEKLKFVMDVPRSKYTLEQDSLLYIVSKDIRKYALSVEKVDKKLSIIDMKFTSKDEQFAKFFSEIMVKNVTEFYVENKTRKLKANVSLLQNKVDSVKNALDNEMLNSALSQDQNQNPSRVQGRLPILKRQMNIQILTTMFGELLRNLELTKLTLMREEPLIQLIDRPIFPLQFKKPGKIISFILGGFLGAFLTISYYIVKKVYDDAMLN